MQSPGLLERALGFVGAIAGVLAFVALTANITSTNNLALGAISALIAFLAYLLMRRLTKEREAKVDPTPPPR